VRKKIKKEGSTKGVGQGCLRNTDRRTGTREGTGGMSVFEGKGHPGASGPGWRGPCTKEDERTLRIRKKNGMKGKWLDKPTTMGRKVKKGSHI